MKQATSKSSLKNVLKVEVPTRRAEFLAVFLDGCAVMRTIPWPLKGTIQDYLDSFRRHIHFYLQTSQVYLIFDR